MNSDPLAIDSDWSSDVPLVSLEAALEQSLLQSGLRREDYLRRLMADLHQPSCQTSCMVWPSCSSRGC